MIDVIRLGGSKCGRGGWTFLEVRLVTVFAYEGCRGWLLDELGGVAKRFFKSSAIFESSLVEVISEVV